MKRWVRMDAPQNTFPKTLDLVQYVLLWRKGPPKKLPTCWETSVACASRHALGKVRLRLVAYTHFVGVATPTFRYRYLTRLSKDKTQKRTHQSTGHETKINTTSLQHILSRLAGKHRHFLRYVSDNFPNTLETRTSRYQTIYIGLRRSAPNPTPRPWSREMKPELAKAL